MLFYLMILIMILFTLYHFYRDFKDKLNTGNTFAEGFSGNDAPSGGTYYFAPDSKTFMEHYEAALAMGGNLASIHSEEDNQKVLDAIPDGLTRVWIGAIRKRPHSDQSTDANTASGKDPRYWGWTDGSEWNYSNFRNGEPNDCCKGETGNIGEIYGEIQKSDGKWNDIFHQHNGNIQKFPAVYKLNVNYPNTMLYKKRTDKGKSWQQQKELCNTASGNLPTRKELLNFMKGKPVNSDVWVPTKDSDNSWLEIGNRKSRSGLTPDYGMLHQDIPDVAYNPSYSVDGKPTWGTKTGSGGPGNEYLYCNIPQNTISKSCALEYCNAHDDLKNAFCNGEECTTDEHAQKCMNHWHEYGYKEDRNKNPVDCTKGLEKTTSTKETTSIDPNTGAKIQEKCVTVSELNTAAAWVDKLFATLGRTKCADKEKIMAAKTASKTDFISGVIKGYENDREKSNQYYMSAIDKAKPHLERAFSNNNAANEMMTGGQNIQQTNAPVVNNIAPPQQPTWQDQQMAQQFNSQNNQQQNNNYEMSNKNLVIPGTGSCPNGCRAPSYDSNMCANELLNGKEYRRCPWVNDANKNESCDGCGAILLPKNEYGYAKTRPGLFNDITIDSVAKNVSSIHKENNDINYLKIGKDFMNDLSRIKNFRLPNIPDNELKAIGKLVHKYELEKNESGDGKLYLTSLVNSILNKDLLPSNNSVLSNSDQKPRGITIKDRMDSQDIMSHHYNNNEASSDNRLGGSKSAYSKNYRPVDPRKQPNPYDSVWDIFKN